jgi:hypothetical protein
MFGMSCGDLVVLFVIVAVPLIFGAIRSARKGNILH